MGCPFDVRLENATVAADLEVIAAEAWS